MNTKKIESNADYLLPQSLDGLHLQSREWLDTIAFWKDETRFFANLMKKREQDMPEVSEYPKLLKNLDALHDMLFDYLSKEIQQHERLLSQIESGASGLADSDYREEHRRLAHKIRVFASDFREFKRMVFGYARKW